jgi:hypothetical protein
MIKELQYEAALISLIIVMTFLSGHSLNEVIAFSIGWIASRVVGILTRRGA